MKVPPTLNVRLDVIAESVQFHFIVDHLMPLQVGLHLPNHQSLLIDLNSKVSFYRRAPIEIPFS